MPLCCKGGEEKSLQGNCDLEDLSKLVRILQNPLQKQVNRVSQVESDVANIEDTGCIPEAWASSPAIVRVESEICGNEEATALEQFSLRYKSCREFSQTKYRKYFNDIFAALVKNRLCLFNWTDEIHHENILRVLTCLRILMRDGVYHKVFMELDGIRAVSELFSASTESYMRAGNDSATIAILKEIINIIDKLCIDDARRDAAAEFGSHKHLVMLLFAKDLLVLQCTFQALLSFVQSPRARSLVVELNSVDTLLLILQDYDLVYKKLAAQLLRMLLVESQAKETVKVFDGVPILLSLLHSDSITLLWHIIWCLVLLSGDDEVCSEVRSMGGIPLLLSMLHDRKFASETSTASVTTPSSSSDQTDDVSERHLSLMSACCACLTELVVNDTNGQQTVQNNGIYLLALLVLPQSPSGDSSAKCKALVNLQAYAFRALRFLFSMERNRRHFKRLLPPALFESFIDIGHYNRNIEPYIHLVEKINSLPEEAVNEIRDNVEACNQNRTPSHYVGEYAILEQLGSGAFGTVYKVQRKSTAQSYFAMKEINTFGVSFGKTSKERQTSVGAIISELSIIREQLKHPNIVRYYKTFQQGDKLYIVMELIEGASLAEHFASLKEKQETFSEERIWNIFFQMILALRYLHKEKGIVHRDLTPSNVMLGENDKVTVTDFGLAKQKRKDCSKMNSVVGTILYSCPEILKNEPYGEKADVWALGCILYQLCTLNPPFYSNNMLQLATKIVEARYEPLPDGVFSAKLCSTIAICITSAPEARPDVVGVSSHVADLLLIYLDNIRKQQIILEKKLERERRRTQNHYYEVHCQTEDFHRLERQKKLTSLASSEGSGDMKDEAEMNGAFVEESMINRNIGFHGYSDGQQSSVATPDWGTDEDDSRTCEDSGLGKSVLSRQPSVVIPRPPEGTPNSRRKYRNFEKSGHCLTVDVCNKLNGRDSGLGSGSPSPLRTTPVLSSASTPSEESFVPINHKTVSSAPGNPSESSPIATPVAIHPSDLGKRCCPRPKSFSSLQDGVNAVVRRGRTSGRTRPVSAMAALTISPRKVRPVTDPILQMLDQVHRIIYLTQLPPTLYRNPRRRAVECFKRALFDADSTSVTLKNELHKLLSESRDVIDLNLGQVDAELKLARQVSQEQEAIAASNAKSGFEFDLELVGEVGITYEQMASIIEGLLVESNYYTPSNSQQNSLRNKSSNPAPLPPKPS